MAEPDGELRVTVALAEPGGQRVVELALEAGATVADAVSRSGLLAGRPELTAAGLGYGIFGRVVGGEHVLETGDRVEILRPLVHDPQDRRRRLARAARTRARRERR